MRSFLAIALIALLATTAFAHEGHDHDHAEEEGETEVVVLTDETFDAYVKDTPLALIEFFAPWCGHCKQLAPQFAKASIELKGTASLASVDCTIYKDLCSKFGVQGFPTLKVFRGNDKPGEYQGGRQAPDIVKYLRKQTEPAFIEVNDDSELDKFLNRDGVDIIGLFKDFSSEAAEVFKKVAETLRNDYNFAISKVTGHADKYNDGKEGFVLVKDEGDAKTHVAHSGETTDEAVTKFIKAEAFPLVGDIGPENFQKYLDRGLPLVWAFVDEKKNDASVLNALTEAAKATKGQISVVKLDGVRWAEHAKHFGLSGKLPGVVAEDRENSKNYVFPESNELTAESLTAHLKGFLDGTLTATLKSQDPPKDNNGPVKVVVGKTFEEIVLDADKDVLVEFYAPWCGHCKTLAPKWEKLGKMFAKNKNVVIAKVDATENDTPASVQGFPTIIFWPKGGKDSPMTYEGDRTVEALAKYVKENGGTFSADDKPADAEAAGHDEL